MGGDAASGRISSMRFEKSGQKVGDHDHSIPAAAVKSRSKVVSAGGNRVVGASIHGKSHQTKVEKHGIPTSVAGESTGRMVSPGKVGGMTTQSKGKFEPESIQKRTNAPVRSKHPTVAASSEKNDSG